MIDHFIQDLVACFFRKNQHLVLRIFTGKYEWGETGNWLHPFSFLPVDVLNPSDRFNIADRAQVPLCR